MSTRNLTGRLLLASIAVFGLGMGVASAYDTCAPCGQSAPVRTQPVVVRTQPVYVESRPIYIEPEVRTRTTYRPVVVYEQVEERYVDCNPCRPKKVYRSRCRTNRCR